MKRAVLYFLLPLAFIWQIGCVTNQKGQINRVSNQSSSEQAVVKDIFWEWRDDIIHDRWDKAYALTSQGVKNSYGNSFENWRLDYEASGIKDYLKDIVEVKQIGIGDDGMATIAVEMLDKTKILWTAVNEMGRWRIEKVIPPR